MGTVTFRKVDVDGIKVFYRETGPKDAPTIMLLHGFPTASHMFRNLIPQLADRFRLDVVKSFWCKTTQFCATRRECEMAETPSVRNETRAGENERKTSFLN
jgi:hypothetical protein